MSVKPVTIRTNRIKHLTSPSKASYGRLEGVTIPHPAKKTIKIASKWPKTAFLSPFPTEQLFQIVPCHSTAAPPCSKTPE
jgi:hypothetical protein